ncbi:hypothetical protein D3C84_986220 [compost metagenome]
MLQAVASLRLTDLHGIDRLLRASLQLLDKPLIFSGGILRFACQAPDLVRDHSKTSTLLPCPGGFNSRIQGKQIGLLGNSTDHPQDCADIFALRCQLLDRCHRVGYVP